MGRSRSVVFAWAGILAMSGSAVAAQTGTGAAPGPAKPGAPAQASVSAEPAATSAIFGDWTLRCQRIEDGDKAQRLCEVAQTIQVQNRREPIAQVALGRVSATAPLRVTAVLPPNVSFPSTVGIAAGDKDPPAVELGWRRCVPGGCFADAPASDEVLRGWRGLTTLGRITFKDAEGRTVAVPLSFRGLAQALDALAKP